MLVSLDMGAFIIIKKNLESFKFSEEVEHLIFLKNTEIEKNSLKEQKNQYRSQKSCIRELLNLLTNADRSTDNTRKCFLRGTYGRSYGGTEGGGAHISYCSAEI